MMSEFEEMGAFLVNRSKWEKMQNENFDLFSNNCLLKEACPEILKIIQETNFDMGFQKINIRDRYKEALFFSGYASHTVIFE
jgi:hypothetical protein